ncbi:MAG: hypothetical protein U1D55_14955 [Phycisphaerae bacterium]
MIRVRFVGEGPRDEAIVPPLVSGWLGKPTWQPSFVTWSKLVVRKSGRTRTLRGLARKLEYAVSQALTDRQHALVATIDRDRAPPSERLSQMRSGITAPSRLPAALGEADPHAEAWLLDDPRAVRDGLDLPADTPLNNVRKCVPKAELNALCEPVARERGCTHLQLLKEIARRVQINRCNHPSETGLQAFHNEVRSNLGSLAGVVPA